MGEGDLHQPISPSCAESGSLAGTSSVVSDSAKSSQHDLHPSRGIVSRDGEGRRDRLNERQLVPAVIEARPPADADRDWGYTRAFLTGLNLWPLPIVLLVPTALLALCGGGR